MVHVFKLAIGTALVNENFSEGVSDPQGAYRVLI